AIKTAGGLCFLRMLELAITKRPLSPLWARRKTKNKCTRHKADFAYYRALGQAVKRTQDKLNQITLLSAFSPVTIRLFSRIPDGRLPVAIVHIIHELDEVGLEVDFTGAIEPFIGDGDAVPGIGQPEGMVGDGVNLDFGERV